MATRFEYTDVIIKGKPIIVDVRTDVIKGKPIIVDVKSEATDVVVNTDVALSELAVQINEAHGQVLHTMRLGLQYARTAGELLLDARERLDHGQFLPWLKANCTVSQRQAQKYIRLAGAWTRLLQLANANSGTHFDDLTINKALALLAEPRQIPATVPRENITDTSTEPDASALIAAKRAEEPFASRIAAVQAKLAEAKVLAKQELAQIDREIAATIQREGAVVDLTPCTGLMGTMTFGGMEEGRKDEED